MTTLIDSALPCDRCGYDVRAQPADGVCPECGESVERSRQAARIPRRPAWRDSDPRWRRRVLAGAWVLVCVPGVAVLRATGWDRLLPMPTFYAVQGTQTLADSFVPYVWGYLTFCVGVVLLFARERGRRAGRHDWTRRWGVVASYGVLLLGAIPLLFLCALVTIGIGALCVSMPLKYQPAYGDWFRTVGVAYLRHGPHPTRVGEIALPACSAIVVLLACVPLYDALRSCGRRGWAIALVAPLALFALRQFVYLALDATGILPRRMTEISINDFYFGTEALYDAYGFLKGVTPRPESYVEATKWLTCLAIAVRLSVAQLAAYRRRTIAPTAARGTG